MKKISAMVTGMLLLLTILNASAQDADGSKPSFIQPYHLTVTVNKTTNLVFPYAIKSVDRGSRDLLVQKAIGVENILQVKAARKDFTETNLTVVTADGSLFPYIINYTEVPGNLNLVFNRPDPFPKSVAVFAKDATTDEIAQNAGKVSGKKRVLKGIKDHNYDMVMDIKGLYIHNDILYFQLDLLNNSAINYDVQSLRFFIHDKKKSKRTASQEVEIQPLYVLGNADLIRNASEQIVCVALPKFTIPDKKYLSAQLMEKNGGRHLSLKISNKALLKAIPL